MREDLFVLFARYFPRFFAGTNDYRDLRRVAVVLLLTLSACVAALLYGFVALLQGQFFRMLMDAVSALIFLFNLLYLRRYGLSSWNNHLTLSMIALLLALLYAYQGLDDYGYVWLFTFPAVAVFLRGSLGGGVAALIMTSPILIVNQLGGKVTWLVDRDPGFETSFLLTYLVISATVVLFEHISEKYREEIHDFNRSLEVTIQERTEELARKNERLSAEIADRIKAEEKMQAALTDKEILLKEVYHRTKNNMNVIASLLNMQKNYAGERDFGEILETVEQRIHSMATVHERLYQSENVATLDLGEYVQDLVAQLKMAYSGEATEVILDHHSEKVPVALDQAIPLGLAINEILTNTFKHALKPGKTLKITSRLARSSDHKAVLSLADNGPGLPDTLLNQQGQTLGTHLIHILVRDQLDAELAISNVDGTKYTISFPILNPDSV